MASAPKADTPMMRQFYAIKKSRPDCILFFRMGDFYEMFGDDAVVAAKVLQIALTSRNRNSPNAIPMCGVPFHAYENYLNKLISAGYKVAICEQTEDPSQAKGLVTRDIVRVVTPGTAVSPQLIDSDQTHYLLALHLNIKAQKLGVAFVDVSTGEFEVLEFPLSALARVYDFLFQLAPREILLPKSRSPREQKVLDEIVTHLEATLGSKALGSQTKDLSDETSDNPVSSWNLCQFLDPYCFDLEAAQAHLKKHFEVFNLEGFGINHLPHAVCAAGAVFSYLEDTQKCFLSHITRIRQHHFDDVMLLDENTISGLELFESKNGEPRHTLFHILNDSCTPMGGRLLRQWLRAPLLNETRITERLDAVEEYQKETQSREALRSCLSKIQDLPRIVGRVSLPTVKIVDMVALRLSLEPLPELPELLKHCKSSLLQKLALDLDPLNELHEHLSRWLLEEPATKLHEGNFIGSEISTELDELREVSQNTKQILNEVLQKEKEATGIPSLKISYNKVFGYYFNVSNAHKRLVPDHYIRKQTLVNAERYITMELKDLEEKILGAEERIHVLEYDLFQELRTQVLSYIPRIQESSERIANLDVLSNFAHVSVNNNYVRPRLRPLDTPRWIRFTGSRHPVIEQVRLEESFIPNDVTLDEEMRVLLITGPNMAGKSTFMRQVALLVLMAQCGCCVPAESAEFSVVDRVFTRVGASDNLSSGQSTFMMEMNEAAAILNNATDRSLIILDEIGRGTSTFDGISIAWAIVEHLQALEALTLCATHYHELTAIAEQFPAIKNFHVLVEEDGEHIIFARKIVAGEADRSYGVHVAQLAGLPQIVVKRASELLHLLEENAVTSHLPESLLANKQKSKRSKKPTPILQDSVQETPPQLSFFQAEHPCIESLRKLDPLNMTPLEALNCLHQLKQSL